MSIITGIPNISAAAFWLAQKQKSGAILFVCKNDEELEEFAAAAQTFAARESGGANGAIILGEDKFTLYGGLYALARGGQNIIAAATYETAALELPGKKDFLAGIISVKIAQNLPRADLLTALETAGYRREAFAEKQGDYAVRGSVVDIFPVSSALPARVYFSANTVSTIALFDPETQNTKTNLADIDIIPLEYAERKSSLKHWARGFEVYLWQPPQGNPPDFEGGATVIAAAAAEGAHDCGLRPNAPFNADLKLFDAQARELYKDGWQIIFHCLNRGEAERLQEVFADYESLKKMQAVIAPLRRGFRAPAQKTAYFTSGDALNRSYRSGVLIKRFDSAQARRVRFKELETGDYIVHQEHGIGRYAGMETLDNEGIPVDCLVIEFKRGERLYVPAADFRKIQKYIGLRGRAPRISSLSGNAWKEVKKRVKEDAQKTAKEILKMEAMRQANEAQNLLGDERLEREFADSFPYEQTEDQTKAIAEITADIALQRPMDRVLVGDVGFGKTEVAMRAALRAVLSGAQTLLLVPTTVLAAQHYKTFSARMAGFPARIAMMSRFQTKKEQRQTAADIKNGLVDIAIGTHRLLSKDIEFKNLGLCIIDEEHRFGVKQKEKIKAKAAGVHTLMLSATPIPRTLNQSLSSLRDMSLIETAPQGRMPIKTRVLPYGDDIVALAARDEIARGGQIFYVYNKVESMPAKLQRLKELLPEARICMAHGQLEDAALEETLWDFYNKKYDMLLASTIIESGLDVTNANTLIIENAQDFGLAQLYQLRGRIGRGETKAFCYLLHPDWLLKKKEEDFAFDSFYGKIKKKEKSPVEEAQKRLAAIMEFSELGSGFKLALRDLEIRGGGELLGIRQHGYANEVGLSLYCDLVAAEVKKLKGQYVPRPVQAVVNLRLPAYIPPDYMPSDGERLRYYKEFMAADAAQKRVLLKKLENIAGPAPAELLNLVEIMQLSQDAGPLHIRQIEGGGDFTEFYFTRDFKIPPAAVGAMLERFKNNIKFLQAPNGDGIRIYGRAGGQNPIQNAKDMLQIISRIILNS
ncbi:MAG: DEAD/DEAH box helicase [Elusimicrobiota bacterium]|jgi:transcription-repair coupling factor (superfamily II helicase)|nr:DEAD/DEAH box helicase [Elusimicrobiota bacterium]